MSDDLYEHETETDLSREEAAAKLRALADSLEKQNSVTVHQGEKDVTVSVPARVSYEYEVEIEEDGSAEIEVSLSWKRG
jgi:amphi-Trp domain-containing protein